MPSKEAHPHFLCRRRPCLLWLLPLLQILVWILFLVRHYEIRAFSDPLNWLHFASHLKTEIQTSMFAVGFPLFLRGALAVMGPFHIFWVNLPILLFCYLLGTVLVAQARPGREGLPGWQIAAVTFTFFFCFDRWLVLILLNPYRDPLSYLLALGAMVLAVRHARCHGEKRWQAPVIGLLMGFACAVREASIILLLPLGLYVLWSWLADRRIRLFRNLLGFGIGFAVGICPLWIQSLICTGQLLLPAQSVIDQQFMPGIHLQHL
ncbi:MAG: hypothetical protein LBN38_03975, partial [Verrucomicrobiota bacterium]|nr:hypothetical protein [Verrucomicrobiota bacterium]